MTNVLRRISAGDQTNEPGAPLAGHRGAQRLSDDARAEIVEAFRLGVKIRVLAERYSVSESCVKRMLRRSGVGRRQRRGHKAGA
jgi:transposase-like protein